MKQQINRQRLFISHWYLGAGSKISVFSARPKLPFSKIKEIYQNELPKHGIKNSKKEPKLSEAFKIKLKARLIKEHKILVVKKILTFFFSILITALFFYTIVILFERFFF